VVEKAFPAVFRRFANVDVAG